MNSFDWTAVALGLAIGTAMSVMFFAGLGLGMQIALRSARPVALLLVSAIVRMAVLLGVGFLVVGQAGPWSLLGYASAFLIIRFITTTVVRIGAPIGDAQ